MDCNNIEIEVKVKELLKIGYVKVNKSFFKKIARRYFKDKYKIDEFINNEIKKGYILGYIENEFIYVYSKKFVNDHDLNWFKLNICK